MTPLPSIRSPRSWAMPGMLALGVVAGLMFLVAYLGLSALLASRALSQGESLWSLQQKDLVIAVERYALSGDPRYRSEMDASQANLDRIHEAFQALNTLPRDWDRVRESLREVPGFKDQAAAFARLYQWFGWTRHAEEILGHWGAAQGKVLELGAVADSLVSAVDRGNPGEETILLARLESLDREIQEIRQDFIATQDAWAQAVHRGSLLVLLLTALLLVVAGSLALLRVLQRLERSESELSRSEERLRQVTESMEEVFWLTSPDKAEMLYVSPGYEGIWERPVIELYQDPRTWLEAVHPEDRSRVEATLPSQEDGDYDLEYRIRTPSGETRWIHDRAAPVLDEEGRVLGLAGVASDVTRRKLLEEELLRSQRIRTASHLAAGVGHDMNNLLTVIRGHLEFLTLDLPEESPLRPELEAIRQAAERLTELSRELLAVGRSLILVPSQVRVNEVVEEVKLEMEARLGPAHRLVLELERDLPRVRADRVRLADCLRALMGNAGAALPQGGEIRIRTSHRPQNGSAPVETARGSLPPGSYVVVQVEDEGCGIHEDRLEEIFEPFSDGPSLEDPGFMGLAAVLGLMEQMGGGVHLESKPGKGTRVELLLPLDPELR